jgi:hypothetical protein
LFHPGHSIVWSSRLAFFLEIKGSEYHRRDGKQRQQDGKETDLAFPVHGLRQRPRTLRGLDRRCNHATLLFN